MTEIAAGGGGGAQVDVVDKPATTGGLSKLSGNSLASNNAQVVKNATGQVYGWHIMNLAAAVRHVKLYDKATAPNPAVDTPYLRIPLAAGLGTNVSFEKGIAFALGIGLAIVGGVADNDNTIVAANDVVFNLLYK